jgi:ATP-dependent RNA helicase DDX5/DBP2
MGELVRVLRSKPPGMRIMVFCTTKRMCDQLSMQIMREFRAGAIHGDKRQQERDMVLSAFKAGTTPIMVATDVAARGLDVPNVGLVVNYDFPTGVEDYGEAGPMKGGFSAQIWAMVMGWARCRATC